MITGIKLIFQPRARRRAAYKRWRDGSLSLREALNFVGPSFYPEREDGETIEVQLSGGFIWIQFLDPAGNTTVQYGYNVSDVSRVKIEDEPDTV